MEQEINDTGSQDNNPTPSNLPTPPIPTTPSTPPERPQPPPLRLIKEGEDHPLNRGNKDER